MENNQLYIKAMREIAEKKTSLVLTALRLGAISAKLFLKKVCFQKRLND